MHGAERVLLALAILLAGALVVLICFRPTGTVDLWWTLKVGDYIRSQGAVPRTTLWTIEALSDLPYLCHGWIAALAYSSAAALFGVDAVPAVPTLVAFATFALLILLGRQLGAAWPLAVAIAVLGLWVVVLRMICRAEIFGYLYFVVALNAIAAYTRTRRAGFLAALVPLAVLWANTHGSVLLLLALLALTAAGLAVDAWRRAGCRRDAIASALFTRDTAWIAATWLCAAGAMLVNPYGPDLIGSIVDQSTSSVWGEAIEEWRPLYSLQWIPLRFVVPLLLAIAALALRFRRVSGVSMAFALFLVVLAVSASRHVPFFGLGAAYLLADAARGAALGQRARVALAAGLALLLAGGVFFTYGTLGLQGRSLLRNPSPWLSERGFTYIRENVRGNVLNRWQLGGVLIYFCYPQIRVAIDSRADPYPKDYFRAYQRALYGPASETLDFVDRYAIDHILLDRPIFESVFRRKLPRLDGFRVAFLDERTVVLSRGP